MRGPRLGRHPLHPALVHFPVVFWTVTPVADLMQRFLGGDLWWRCAFWAIGGGLALALPAMVAGFLDLLALPAEHPGQRTGQRHLLLMGAAWTVFVCDLLLRSPAKASAPGRASAELILSLGGFALLLAGAYAGAQLVYHFGVGQDNQERGSQAGP